MPDQSVGNVGYLTYEQFRRFEWAVNDGVKLASWWRVVGYTTAGETAERVQSSFGHPLNLPPAWLAADEVTRLLNELNQWGELEDVANDIHGQYLAMLLTREVETAKARWPVEDRKRKVRYMRCQSCNRISLRYHPPRFDRDDIVVQCSEADCRAYMSEKMFGFAAALIEQENRLRADRDRKRRLGDDDGSDGADGKVETHDLQVGSGWEGDDDAADAGSLVVPTGSAQGGG